MTSKQYLRDITSLHPYSENIITDPFGEHDALARAILADEYSDAVYSFEAIYQTTEFVLDQILTRVGDFGSYIPTPPKVEKHSLAGLCENVLKHTRTHNANTAIYATAHKLRKAQHIGTGVGSHWLNYDLVQAAIELNMSMLYVLNTRLIAHNSEVTFPMYDLPVYQTKLREPKTVGDVIVMRLKGRKLSPLWETTVNNAAANKTHSTHTTKELITIFKSLKQ